MGKIKVELIALSNYADISRDGKLSINGIFDEIFANQFPSQFLRGFLVFTLSGMKPSISSNIQVQITDASESEILKQEANVFAGTKGKGHFIAELVGLPLPNAGEYKISLSSEKTLIGSTVFFVSGGLTSGQKGTTTQTVN